MAKINPYFPYNLFLAQNMGKPIVLNQNLGKPIALNENTAEAQQKTLLQFLCQTKPNNWLKMHGLPMRRKPHGTRKNKKQKWFYIDEVSSFFMSEDTTNWHTNYLRHTRKYTPPNNP